MALNPRFDPADGAFRDAVRAFRAEPLTEDLGAAARQRTTGFADRGVAPRRQRSLRDAPGPGESSLRENASVDLGQRRQVLKLETVGSHGLPPHERSALPGHGAPPIGPGDAFSRPGRCLNRRGASTFGGSREVQKNNVARAVLGP